MKKLGLILLGLFVSSASFAAQISVATFSADSGVNHLNNFRSTVVDVINGNLEGSTDGGSTISNIKADTIYEINMADDANPRLRDSELLSITYDTTSSQGSFVASGCTPATDTDLTSDISACTAYVNGYRVTKAATAHTYTASKDTYVDLSQTGAYNFSEVTVGAAAPSVAANSARLAKVTTDGTQITTVTDLANRRIPGLIVPANYRVGCLVSRDTTSTITVLPGSFEVNSTMINKTSNTTLTLSTAGDWAGGVSLRATSAYGYVGSDSSGNLKLHTTAPTHDNYGLTTTTGKKRYASWSSTTYRILGWFYMNSTGSGELNTYEVGNIKEGDVPNYTSNFSSTSVNTTSQTFTDDTQATSRFYSSGNPVTVIYAPALTSGGSGQVFSTVSVDSAGTAFNWSMIQGGSTATYYQSAPVYESKRTLSQGTHTMQGKFRGTGDTVYVNARNLIIQEE